jgi:hypothetical protein
MSFPISARKGLFAAALLLGLHLPLVAQSTYVKQGGEYDVAGPIAGDQITPALDFNSQGGYLVWSDNATSSGGSRIGARRLNQNLSGTFEVFQVNSTAAGLHDRPKVSMLADGGAVFVWQGGDLGKPSIYARFMSASGAFLGDDVLVNTHTGSEKEWPSVVCLKDGSVVIVWESASQDDAANSDVSLRDLRGVYARRFSATGVALTGEILVNQTVSRSQRNPSVTSLPDGGFAVAWISERLVGVRPNNPESAATSEGANSVMYNFTADVLARVFSPEGQPVTGEFTVNVTGESAGAPQISAANGFINAVWMQKRASSDSYDIVTRRFTSAGALLNSPVQLNQYSYGDQAFPQIANIGDDSIAVWISLNQDGNGREVYGRLIDSDGALPADEFRVNTAIQKDQKTPVIGSDSEGRFLVVWSSYYAGRGGFDLFAQRYSGGVTLPAPESPYLSALSQTRISVTWPEFAGLEIAEYLIYLGDNTSPLSVTGNMHTVTGLSADTVYSFRLAYRLVDGRTSPKSEPVSLRTWGHDENFDGLPDDWQLAFWGTNPFPPSNFDSDADGASNAQEFLAGTNPLDASSVLKTKIITLGGIARLEWNTVPGSIYRLQVSSNFSDWDNVGDLRFSPGQTDSVPLNTSESMVIYRVIRIR